METSPLVPIDASISLEPGRVPMLQSLTLHDHKKSVSALSIDHSGSRFVSGSHDYSLRFWDFHGMDRISLKPFRTLEQPCGGYVLRDLQFASKGGSDKVLVVPYSAQAKIMSRDGASLVEFAKGDQYLLDMKNTKGHVTCINSGIWHPQQAGLVLTASNDSTVRFWDIDDPKKQKGIIVVKSKMPGTKSPVTVVRMTNDGRSVVTASQDGSLKLWSASSSFNYPRPLMAVDQAHVNGFVVSDMQITADNQRLISRSLDGTMKLWDLRKFKAPVKCWDDLPTSYDEASVALACHERYLLVGASGSPESTLQMFSMDTMELSERVSFSTKNPIKILWHEKLFQLLVSFSDGSIQVFWDDAISQKGAKLVTVHRTSSEGFVVSEGRPAIQTPHSLPLFREESNSLKRQRQKDRLDPVKSHRPDLPVEGQGKGGRIGSNVTQHLVRHIVRDKTRDENPREALLKYAELAEKDPKFITPAYQATQPKAILAEKPLDFKEANSDDEESGSE